MAKRFALFFAGAMFWGAIINTYLAVKKVGMTWFGLKIDAEENWMGAGFHMFIALLLLFYYNKKSGYGSKRKY